jgi:hypothetical protein
VNVQTVLAGAVLLKRPEQPSFRYVEWSALEITAGDGSIDVAVFIGVSNIDCQIAGMNFDIFVASQLLYGGVSERHTQTKIHYLWHFNDDAETVSGASADMKVSLGS